MAEFDQYATEYNAHMQELLGDCGYYASGKVKNLSAAHLLTKDTRVLDFGCGIGVLSTAIRDQFPNTRIDGYDLSEESLEKIPQDMKNTGIFSSNLDDFRSDYDLIVLTNVMHHIIPDDRATALKLAYQRLIRGGALAVIEHNPINPLTRKIVRDCPFDKNAILLPHSETCSRLSAAGLVNVRVRFTVFVPNCLKMLAPVETLLTWCPLGAQYLAYGVRKEN